MRFVFQCLKPFSLTGVLILAYVLIISGVLFDNYAKINFNNDLFRYDNRKIIIILVIVFTSILFVLFKFWYESRKLKESKNKEIIIILKDPFLSNNLKKEFIKFLRE